MTGTSGAPAGRSPQWIDVHGATDQGLVREENQDTFAIIHRAGGPGEDGVLLVVADGMGGLAGGGTASRIVVETLGEAYRAHGAGNPLSTLRDAVQAANLKVYSRSGELPEPAPMGSTVTAAAISGRTAWIVHVGDSRAYRVPPAGPMLRLTQDHSWVEELTRRGELTQGSILFSLHRNVLTRGVGLRPELQVDVVEIRDLAPGDLLLISSDGLHGVAGDAEIESRSKAHRNDLPALTADLIGLARDRGGPDNITLVAARIEGPPPAPASAAEREGSTVVEDRARPGEEGSTFARKGVLVLSLIAAFALAVGTMLLLGLLSPDEEPPAKEDLLEGVLKEVNVPVPQAPGDVEEKNPGEPEKDPAK